MAAAQLSQNGHHFVYLRHIAQSLNANAGAVSKADQIYKNCNRILPTV
jgi:hypothetical protein